MASFSSLRVRKSGGDALTQLKESITDLMSGIFYELDGSLTEKDIAQLRKWVNGVALRQKNNMPRMIQTFVRNDFSLILPGDMDESGTFAQLAFNNVPVALSPVAPAPVAPALVAPAPVAPAPVAPVVPGFTTGNSWTQVYQEKQADASSMMTVWAAYDDVAKAFYQAALLYHQCNTDSSVYATAEQWYKHAQGLAVQKASAPVAPAPVAPAPVAPAPVAPAVEA
jgi:hypothetical protein